MYTLQEFIRFTNGWEYIIAIIAGLAFMGFWRVLAGKLVAEEDHEEPGIDASHKK